MTLYDFLKAAAVIQGSWCFGISAVILFYYITRVPKFSLLQIHVIVMVVAHNLLTWATITTLMSEKWGIGDPWFWMVGAAYLGTDISLYVIWKARMKGNLKNS